MPIDASLTDGSITVDLGGDVIWANEFTWNAVAQQVRFGVDGTPVIEYLFPNRGAQPITLECGWLPRAEVDKLIQLRDRAAQAVMTLQLCDGRHIDVFFSHHEGAPLSTNPVVPRPDYTNVPDPDWYITTLKLFDGAYGPY